MKNKVFWVHSGIRFVVVSQEENEWKLSAYIGFKSEDEQLWFSVIERTIKAQTELEIENMAFAILEEENWTEHIEAHFPNEDDKILIPSVDKSFFPEIVIN